MRKVGISGRVISETRRGRSATLVQLFPQRDGAASDLLKLQRAKPRNDGAPLADGCGTDVQRPRDIRGVLKVINNFGLEHAPSVTAVQRQMQPQSKTDLLTSVYMDKLSTLAERLKDAMDELGVSASDLARACSVSPAAVGKWLDGRTKTLSADNYASAARALGVREEWLRKGRLPRERQNAAEERQVDQVIGLLAGLQGPLAELATAIERLTKTHPEPARKRKGA